MQIMNAFKIWAQHGNEPHTIAQVGHAIGLPPSPHLRDMLIEMTMSDDLEYRWRDEEGKLGAHTFLLAERHIITEKFSRRHISLKKCGVVVGQLEMFS